MQIVTKTELYHHETECYGCNTITKNLSGMCTKCGGDALVTESERPEREACTLSRAFDIIERGSL